MASISKDDGLELMPLMARMILIDWRNNQVNRFQVLFSVFCYFYRTQKHVIEVMHELGLVLEYS